MFIVTDSMLDRQIYFLSRLWSWAWASAWASA